MKQATTRMLFSYWDTLRGERAAPERGEIEPGAIRHILADTFILELGAERTPEIRLAGTRFCALFGGELKGRRLESLWPDEAAHEVRRYVDIVVGEAAGVLVGLTGTTAADATLDLEMLLLPLRHRGKPHARMLGVLAPAAIPPWLGIEPLTHLTTVSLRIVWPSGRVPARDTVEVHAIEPRRRFVVHRGGRA